MREMLSRNILQLVCIALLAVVPLTAFADSEETDDIFADGEQPVSRFAQGVYNLNGQLVKQGNSTAGLPSGLYITSLTWLARQREKSLLLVKMPSVGTSS